MSKEYYIIGSGGFAKEVYFLAEETLSESHIFMGFIDREPAHSTINVRNREVAVLDENYFLTNIKPSENISVFHGTGNPQIISKVSHLFRDYNFPNLIHKNFIGDRNSIEMGQGNIITSGCTFTVDIVIGSFNIFNLHTTLGHDIKIDNFNVFNPGCNISGDVTIGSSNLFGTNSTVLQGVTVGNNATLGAASLATRDILNNKVMVGVPAKQLQKSQ